LRRILGLKREELIGWRKLHSGELPDLHFLPNIVRMIKSGGYDGPIMWHVWG
jgi:hypothetical protein